jgi:hypothetical protein
MHLIYLLYPSTILYLVYHASNEMAGLVPKLACTVEPLRLSWDILLVVPMDAYHTEDAQKVLIQRKEMGYVQGSTRYISAAVKQAVE